MPNRSAYNKYELFIAGVRRIARKKELVEEDMQLRDKAALVAVLSSNHSWKTYKYLHNGGEFDQNAFEQEFRAAMESGWKEINEVDVEEVMNNSYDENLLSKWLYYVIAKEEREKLSALFEEMKENFVDGIEPIERVE